MDRTPPIAYSEEIELYVRTYYSLLRSSAPIRVRSLEETHAAMGSNLHQQADDPDIDVSALAYCAMRLPLCIAQTKLMVMGQMEDVFRRSGYDVERWQPVKARARRRKMYYEKNTQVLAAYIASVSDIDDLIPCVTTYQIEWNKLHWKLSSPELQGRLREAAEQSHDYVPLQLLDELRAALDLSPSDFSRFEQIWPGDQFISNMAKAAESQFDISVTVLGSGLSDYRRSVQHWWGRIERDCAELRLTERPVYFVSSNAHSLVNLLSGTVWDFRESLVEFVREHDPEHLWAEYEALDEDNAEQLANWLYYVSRLYANNSDVASKINKTQQKREEKAGVTRITDPHCLDVEAQVIEISKLRRKWLDPRLNIFSDEEWELLMQSDSLIFNIDYPLGMAAYHIFTQVSTAIDRLKGVYVLGKAATLNARVGDMMIPNVVYDEHSRNSYLFRNCFTAQDVAPFLEHGTVFDNQKAVTVRGTILQNREFMHVFYEEGYTDIEMESGPYLSGMYEDIYPKRYPVDEIVNLFINAPYDIGFIHYASDTPISRRKTLLSKSLSYFGVDATYAASVAVLRRILSQDLARQMRRLAAANNEDLLSEAIAGYESNRRGKPSDG